MQDVVRLAMVAVKIGLVVLMVAIGLRARWSEVTHLFRHPRLLAKSILARNIVMPCAAVLLIQVFRLEPIVSGILFALSVTAIPPFLPLKLAKAGGSHDYDIGLFASQTILALILVPASVYVYNQLPIPDSQFSLRQVVTTVGELMILPFGFGMVLSHLAPSHSARLVERTQKTALLVVVAGALVLLVASWKSMLTLIGNGTLVAFSLFVMIGLTAGHLLGGPRRENRRSLALTTASSHPALAVAMVATNAPAQAKVAAAGVLLYLIVSSLLMKPYASHQWSHASHRVSRSGEDRRRQVRLGSDRRSHVT